MEHLPPPPTCPLCDHPLNPCDLVTFDAIHDAHGRVHNAYMHRACWERRKADPKVKDRHRRDKLQLACKAILEAIGEDPTRDGLVDTPRRFADAWLEFADYDPGRTDTAFESMHVDQMVVVKGIHAWSMCEHHLMPFGVEVSIAYVTGEKVLGLSKFARIVERHCHRLQIQERLTADVADEIQDLTSRAANSGRSSVAVLVKGRHLCMCARGIRKDAQMITSSMRGVFLSKPEARAEFLDLVKD